MSYGTLNQYFYIIKKVIDATQKAKQVKEIVIVINRKVFAFGTRREKNHVGVISPDTQLRIHNVW